MLFITERLRLLEYGKKGVKVFEDTQELSYCAMVKLRIKNKKTRKGTGYIVK